eukprot:2647550-Rhodomonas_salina.7
MDEVNRRVVVDALECLLSAVRRDKGTHQNGGLPQDIRSVGDVCSGDELEDIEPILELETVDLSAARNDANSTASKAQARGAEIQGQEEDEDDDEDQAEDLGNFDDLDDEEDDDREKAVLTSEVDEDSSRSSCTVEASKKEHSASSAGFSRIDGLLLGKLWPPDRVLLGLRVCKWLRDVLESNAARVVLNVCGSRTKHSSSDLNFGRAISRFRHEAVELQLIAQSCSALLPAMLPAISSSLDMGWTGSIVHLDVAQNKLRWGTGSISPVSSAFAEICLVFTQALSYQAMTLFLSSFLVAEGSRI